MTITRVSMRVEKEGEGEEEEEDGDEEEDLEPLLPTRRQKTSGTRVEGVESSPTVRGTQVQGRFASSSGRPDPSPEASPDSNDRAASSWTLGGTQVQRKVISSLGRRPREDLPSDASQDSNPRDKRLCLESSPTAGVPSSPPYTPGSRSVLSVNSDALSASGTPGKPVPRRFLKQEFVPPCNQLVSTMAKKLVQAEVFACHPWPNTSTIESLVRRCWTNAIRIREEERRATYPGANDKPPTKEPDEISLEIVSSRLPYLKESGLLIFPRSSDA